MCKIVLYALLFASISQQIFAQDTDVTGGDTSDEPKVIIDSPSPAEETPIAHPDGHGLGLDSSPFKRNQILANYSFADTWIPSKWGMSYGRFVNKRFFEIEWLNGSLAFPFFLKDLGGFSDQRFSLLLRGIKDSTSFHFFGGLSYHSFSATLGSAFVSTASGGEIPQYDLLKIQSLGLVGGLGHRWQWKNGFTLGFDWFTTYWPLFNLMTKAEFLKTNGDENKKNEIRDALDLVKHIPVFSVGKIQVGYSF